MTEDPRQTRRNGLDPRTAQSRSARSGGGSSCHVLPGFTRHTQPASSLHGPPAAAHATRPRTRRTPRYARHARPAATRTSQVPKEAARRAFSSNCPITQCDAVCKLAGIRPHATATCTKSRMVPPALNGRAHASAACAPPFTPVRGARDQGQQLRLLLGGGPASGLQMSPSNEPTGPRHDRVLAASTGVLAGQRGAGCEIRTREGLPPTRFPTMLASVHRRPPPSANCANTIRVATGERRRTGMNETKTEPRPGPRPAAQVWRPSRWTE